VREAERKGVQVIRSQDFAAALAAPTRSAHDEDAGADANPVITAAEVAYWLELFEALSDEEDNPNHQR
jgi:hypothetical protein